jgi:hypothetical protein
LELQDAGFLKFWESEGFHSTTLGCEIHRNIFELFKKVGLKTLDSMIKKDNDNG